MLVPDEESNQVGTDTVFEESRWINAIEMSCTSRKSVPSTVLHADSECLEGEGGISDDLGPSPNNFMSASWYMKGIKPDAAAFLNVLDQGLAGFGGLDSTTLHPEPTCGRFCYGMEKTEVSGKSDAQLEVIQGNEAANQGQRSTTSFIQEDGQAKLPPPEPPRMKSELEQ